MTTSIFININKERHYLNNTVKFYLMAKYQFYIQKLKNIQQRHIFNVTEKFKISKIQLEKLGGEKAE